MDTRIPVLNGRENVKLAYWKELGDGRLRYEIDHEDYNEDGEAEPWQWHYMEERVPVEKFVDLLGEGSILPFELIRKYHSDKELAEIVNRAGRTYCTADGRTCVYAHDYVAWVEEKEKKMANPKEGSGRIPRGNYLLHPNGETVITWDMVRRYHPGGEVKDFVKHMFGQTVCFMPDGKTEAIYVRDYEMWLGTLKYQPTKPRREDMIGTSPYRTQGRKLTAKEEIEQSQFEFYLTGSRFFETSTLHSDWDYFCEDGFDVRMWLERNGFNKEFGAYYNDQNTMAVYQRDNVHVQCVKDVNMKMKIQSEMFDNNMGILLTNKTRSRKLWQFAYDLLGVKKEK